MSFLVNIRRGDKMVDNFLPYQSGLLIIISTRRQGPKKRLLCPNLGLPLIIPISHYKKIQRDAKRSFLPAQGGLCKETRPKNSNFYFRRSEFAERSNNLVTWVRPPRRSRVVTWFVEQCLSKLRVDYDRVCVRASPW